MEGIAKEIPPIHVVNVNVIGIQPCQRPWVNHGKPETAVLKTPRSAREIGTVHVERVATTKTGAEAVVGNPPVGCRRLCLSSLLLRRSSRLLRALLLLSRSSRLLRALLLLRRFGLLLLLLWLLLLFAWSLCVGGSNGCGK